MLTMNTFVAFFHFISKNSRVADMVTKDHNPAHTTIIVNGAVTGVNPIQRKKSAIW